METAGLSVCFKQYYLNTTYSYEQLFIFLQCSDTVGWAKEGHPACKQWQLVGSDDSTRALHVLQFKLSPPLPSYIASMKPANPGSPGKNGRYNGERTVIYYSKTSF